MISKASLSARVIILSMHHTAEHVSRVLQAGARGYLLKESAGDKVVKAVRSLMQGKSFFSRGWKSGRNGIPEGARTSRRAPLTA